MRKIKFILVFLFILISSGVLINFIAPINIPTEKSPTEYPTEDFSDDSIKSITLSVYELIF